MHKTYGAIGLIVVMMAFGGCTKEARSWPDHSIPRSSSEISPAQDWRLILADDVVDGDHVVVTCAVANLEVPCPSANGPGTRPDLLWAPSDRWTRAPSTAHAPPSPR